MEGLGAAANGLAVVSVAVQLTESCIKLYKFWESVEDAPHEITTIKEDLQFLISVFKRIESVKRPLGECIAEGIEHCWGKLLELNAIVEKFDEGFQSLSRRRRKWTAFKAASQGKHVQRFRNSLSEAKSTLTLALVHQCVVQSQSRSHTVFTGTAIFHNSQNYSALAQSSSDRLLEQFPGGKAIAKQEEIVPPKYTEQNLLHTSLMQEQKTAKAVLTHFEKKAPDRAMTKLKLQELMLHSIGQIRVAKFESNSLEILAQDGYIMDRNGNLSAKTFVYSDNLQYRVSHRATSFQTALGCLWMGKTILHLPAKTRESDEETQCVSSYVLYPNTWVQWLGVRNGLEVIMASAGRNWLFNCRLTITRAVPEDSLIFELCRNGQTRAVEILLSKGLGSVVDTSPNGWKPLHFAAAGGHVDLCAMLIEAGADKSALVYKGPSPAILSPITLFVASAHGVDAEVKISMLRLFSDCIELTDPKSDGWTVHEWLKRAYALENVPISQNSITWLLRCSATEEYVELSSTTIWCGLQHAVRTVVGHTRHGRFLDRILGLSNTEYKAASRKRIDAIGNLVALRACGRVLFPMALNAGAFAQIAGFDWAHDDLSYREYLKALPTLYAAWCNMVIDYTENLECYLRLELDHYQQHLGLTRAEFLDAVSLENAVCESNDTRPKCQVCTSCADESSSLPSALVSPIRIAVTECVKTNHKFGCVCEKAELLYATSRITQLPEYTGKYCLGSNHDTMESAADEEFHDAEPYLFPAGVLADQDTASGMLTEIAIQLYRSHGRAWLGDYAADELLCTSCFLLREQYTDEDGSIADFPPKPRHFELTFRS